MSERAARSVKKAFPRVSVVMPCFNEERFIARTLESLIDDEVRENCEILVVDGMSTDGTRDVVRKIAEKGPLIRLLDNPERTQGYGLNLGIEEAAGDIIARVDAHCLYPEGYIRRCVELLEKTGAENAGGTRICTASRGGAAAQAVALAVRHPMGVGDSRFQLGNFSGYADGAYYGTFRKALFEEIGPYDPLAYPNEDGELNLRILKTGKKIYLDSSIKIVYYPRETLGDLARQYFRYGQGRCYTILKHKRLTSWRQVLPAALVPGLAASLILGLWMPVFFIVPAAYVVSLLGTALIGRFPDDGGRASGKVSLRLRGLVAVAWALMHLSWGSGFWVRLLFGRGRKSVKAIARSSSNDPSGGRG
jgi:succinoglycan biosynthesis protein ExoA